MATPIEGGDVQGGNPNPGGPEVGDSTPGLNPAWNDVLGVLPEQFHQVVTPHFQQWDQAAQKRVEEANSKVKAFEPYQPFVENGISAEDLEQGIQLMYQLNTNPQAVYKAIAEAYDLGSGQVESDEIEGEEEEEGAPNFQDPRVDQIQQGLDLVAQTLLQQEQAKIQQKAESELDAELGALRKKYPNFDEKYVLSIVANGFSMEEAAQAYDNLVQNVLQSNPRPFAPSVMGNSGGGTGLPSQAIDPVKLGDKERRSLVAQMLKQELSD